MLRCVTLRCVTFTRIGACCSAIFAAFGPLKFVDMSHEPSSGRHKGFCFIEYAEDRGADAALAAMNGFELAGRPIKVIVCFSFIYLFWGGELRHSPAAAAAAAACQWCVWLLFKKINRESV